jgi:hypothetical protein
MNKGVAACDVLLLLQVVSHKASHTLRPLLIYCAFQSEF